MVLIYCITTSKSRFEKERIIYRLLKNKKATINPQNNDDNSFQYVLTVALNIKTWRMILQEYQN